MKLEERANKYAEGKALSAISAAIEQAFIDGYNSGYQEGLFERKQTKVVIDDIEYVDLALPSGTKWSSEIFKSKDKNGIPTDLFTYEEALKYNIPTVDQFNELIDFCIKTRRPSFDNRFQNIVDFLGTNREMITFNCPIIKQGNSYFKLNDIMFWLKGDSKSEKEGLCASEKGVVEWFKGSEIPIMLVQ